jgi:hypothetical protein
MILYCHKLEQLTLELIYDALLKLENEWEEVPHREALIKKGDNGKEEMYDAILNWIHVRGINRVLCSPFVIHPDLLANEQLFFEGHQVKLSNQAEVSEQAIQRLQHILETINRLPATVSFQYVNDLLQPSLRIVKQVSAHKQSSLCLCEAIEADALPSGSDLTHDIEHLDPGMVLLQTNIDDQSPEVLAYVMERLMNEGANDVYAQPIQMKKGRMGLMLNVLCPAARVAEMEELLFSETSTLGIRRLGVSVHRLSRTIKKLNTPWGEIGIKIAKHQGRVKQVTPEFEDCRQIALRKQIPLQKIYDWIKLNTASYVRSEDDGD